MHSAHKHFLWVFAASFLLVCILGAALNYLVDPYSLFGTRRIPGFNERKPTASERARVVKPYMALRAKPRVVIGGNSRPEMGLNPRSACWKDAEQPVFNMGIPGASVFMQSRYVQHAVEKGQAQRVLFGIDFFDFLADASKPTGPLDWERLGEAFEGRLDAESQKQGSLPTFQRIDDVFSGLFSLKTLNDSIVTLASQRNPYSATRYENGFNPGSDYVPIIKNEGQAVLFSQKNIELRRSLQQPNLGILDVNGQQTESLQALRQLLVWAKRRSIGLVLFINPYHSDYLVQIEMAGKWALFEDWKRQVTALAAEYRVPLWDFNSIEPYSTESPPAFNDKRSRLRWFWEPAHYRHELGDHMLGAMLARQCGASLAPEKFGFEITEITLQSHLDHLRSELHRFIRENPQVIERLAHGNG